jgi:hypothetical protein
VVLGVAGFSVALQRENSLVEKGTRFEITKN